MSPSPQKIILLTNTFSPEIGAAPARLLYMCKALKEAGFSVEIYTGMPNYPLGKIYQQYKGKYVVHEQMDGLSVTRHWMLASNSSNWGFRLLSMFSLVFSIALFSGRRLLNTKPDWIMVQLPPIALPWLALCLAKIVKAKLALNVSDLWPSAINDLGFMRQSDAYKLLDSMTAFLYKKSDLCLVQSIEIEDFVRKKALETPILLYRTGVDVNLFLPKISYESGASFSIVYVGTLGLAQGVRQVCDQINFRALGASFHIYGDGFEASAIKDFIEKNPNRGIYFHGAIFTNELPATLLQYDAALICQKKPIYGTVPSKLYEAFAVGLPILFHGAGEGAQLVKEHQAGMASLPFQKEVLQANIIHLMEMGAQNRKSMGAHGRIAASTHYSRKQIADGLIAYLRQSSME